MCLRTRGVTASLWGLGQGRPARASAWSRVVSFSSSLLAPGSLSLPHPPPLYSLPSPFSSLFLALILLSSFLFSFYLCLPFSSFLSFPPPPPPFSPSLSLASPFSPRLLGLPATFALLSFSLLAHFLSLTQRKFITRCTCPCFSCPGKESFAATDV